MINFDSPEYNEAKFRIKVSHFTEQRFNIEGVVHVGANNGYEVQWYQKMGIENILCFEPVPLAYKAFKKQYPDIQCEEIALSDKSGKGKIQITKGDAAGSSMLNMIDSGVVRTWKDNKHVVGKATVTVKRFDEWAIENDYKPIYDCLVMDVQGMELKALKGFGEWLGTFKYLNIECSEVPVYEGEAPAKEVIKFLDTKGFIQDSPIEKHNDIFFVRKDVKAASDKIYRGVA